MAAKAPKDDFVTVKLRRVEAEALRNVVGGTPAQAIRKLLTKAQEEENARDVAIAEARRGGPSVDWDEIKSKYGIQAQGSASRRKGTRAASPKAKKIGGSKD